MKLKDLTILDFFVMVLILAQIVLVIILTWNVCSITKATKKALEPEVVTIEQVAQRPSMDSCTVAAAPMPMPERQAVRANAVADNSPTIISIILTLITLCVTLSIVIPYVEGKTMTEGKVQKVAKEYYKESFESIERFYRDTLEDSLWEDAHFSRMTAYFLHKSDDENDKVWSIGWASKAILRYLKLINQNPDRYGRNAYHEIDFIKYCIGYLKEVGDCFDNVDSKKMLRAFSDVSFAAYLAKGFDFRGDLKALMSKIYPRLSELVSSTDIDAILKKHNRANDDEEMERFEKWMTDWIKDKEAKA